VEWLRCAGLVYPSVNVTTARLPLSGYEEHARFKVYVNDCGLLGAMVDLPAQVHCNSFINSVFFNAHFLLEISLLYENALSTFFDSLSAYHSKTAKGDMECERNRDIYVLKARGIKHFNQIREFTITAKGINHSDAYTGANGVLTGTARVAQEALDKASQVSRTQESERKRRELKRKKLMLDSEIALLKSKYESEEDEIMLGWLRI
jgi:hypothetical protein